MVALERESFGEGLDTTIYRIVQEALNNALRHGRPSLIEIKAGIGEDGFVDVEVSDDGGELAASDAEFGFGLTGMKERVEFVGGSLSVRNRVGDSGVSVRAKLPLATVEDASIMEAV